MAAANNVGCLKLRKAAVLGMPPGTVLKTWRRRAFDMSDGRALSLPRYIGEVPGAPQGRVQMWREIKLSGMDGADALAYPPGRYPEKDCEIAAFRELLPHVVTPKAVDRYRKECERAGLLKRAEISEEEDEWNALIKYDCEDHSDEEGASEPEACPEMEETVEAADRTENDQPQIADSNYWQSGPARQGLLRLCYRDRTFRLLVPSSQRRCITEMAKGAKHVVISILPFEQWESSICCVEWMVEDGSDQPWSCLLPVDQNDWTPDTAASRVPFTATVWDCADGKPVLRLKLPAFLRMVSELPCKASID